MWLYLWVSAAVAFCLACAYARLTRPRGFRGSAHGGLLFGLAVIGLLSHSMAGTDPGILTLLSSLLACVGAAVMLIALFEQRELWLDVTIADVKRAIKNGRKRSRPDP